MSHYGTSIFFQDYYCQQDNEPDNYDDYSDYYNTTPCYNITRVLCGGAVICPKYVLTSAHCQDILKSNNVKYSDLLVLGARHNLSMGEIGLRQNGQVDVLWSNAHHDYGLIKMKKEFILGSFKADHYMYAIHLPEAGDEEKYDVKVEFFTASRAEWLYT